MIIAVKTLPELRNATKKIKTKIVQARDLQFNRTAIEQNLVDVLVLPAVGEAQDKTKYLDSGLNQIAATIAAKSRTIIAIDIESLRKMDAGDLGEALARLKQNLRLCTKAKLSLGYLNATTKEGAQALLRLLGATTQQASQAISF
jgi:RNase P/RNase MRP subunit p30